MWGVFLGLPCSASLRCAAFTHFALLPFAALRCVSLRSLRFAQLRSLTPSAAHLASFAPDDVTLSGDLKGHFRGRALREFCAKCGCAVRVTLPGGPLLCAGLLPPGAVDDAPWQLGFCGGE